MLLVDKNSVLWPKAFDETVLTKRPVRLALPDRAQKNESMKGQRRSRRSLFDHIRSMFLTFFPLMVGPARIFNWDAREHEPPDQNEQSAQSFGG